MFCCNSILKIEMYIFSYFIDKLSLQLNFIWTLLKRLQNKASHIWSWSVIVNFFYYEKRVRWCTYRLYFELSGRRCYVYSVTTFIFLHWMDGLVQDHHSTCLRFTFYIVLNDVRDRCLRAPLKWLNRWKILINTLWILMFVFMFWLFSWKIY